MKILRWLLSHSLFILLIVAVIYAYMFWGNLMGEDTPAGKAVAYLSDEFVEVKEFVDAVKAKQAKLSQEHKPVQQSSSSETAVVTTTDINSAYQAESIQSESRAVEEVAVEQAAVEEVAVENNTAVASAEVVTKPVEPQPVPEQAVIEPPMSEQPVPEQKMANSSYNQNEAPRYVASQHETAVKQGTAGVVDSKEELKQISNTELTHNQAGSSVIKTPHLFTVNKTGLDNTAVVAVGPGNINETFIPAEVEKHLNNVDEHGEFIDVSQPTGAVREKWISARKYFYQRNYELSEQSYQQVIENTKNNFDAYGELGNVYFNQGKNEQAASAYFEAAAILVNKGQIYRARSLMGLLRHLDKSKAIELQRLLDSAQS